MSENSDQQEKINEKNLELSEIYEKIMKNENMVAFNKASEKMDTVMNRINSILIAAVNGEDPMLFSEINDLGCNGSCDGCSKCH